MKTKRSYLSSTKRRFRKTNRRRRSAQIKGGMRRWCLNPISIKEINSKNAAGNLIAYLILQKNICSSFETYLSKIVSREDFKQQITDVNVRNTLRKYLSDSDYNYNVVEVPSPQVITPDSIDEDLKTSLTEAMKNIENKEIKKYIKRIILGHERGHSEDVAETIVKSKNKPDMYRTLYGIMAHLNNDSNCSSENCNNFKTILNNLIEAQRARTS